VSVRVSADAEVLTLPGKDYESSLLKYDKSIVVSPLAVLRKTRCFDHVKPAALRALAECAVWEDHVVSKRILEQGSVADAFFVIAEGSVSVTKSMTEQGSAEAVNVVVATLSAGDLFGEAMCRPPKHASSSLGKQMVPAQAGATASGLQRTKSSKKLIDADEEEEDDEDGEGGGGWGGGGGGGGGGGDVAVGRSRMAGIGYYPSSVTTNSRVKVRERAIGCVVVALARHFYHPTILPSYHSCDSPLPWVLKIPGSRLTRCAPLSTGAQDRARRTEAVPRVRVERGHREAHQQQGGDLPDRLQADPGHPRQAQVDEGQGQHHHQHGQAAGARRAA
jgi:hypothetical protein